MSKFLKSLVFCAVAAIATVVHAGSGYTLVVAPARYSVMQVAFDLVQREPVVLVSYQASSTTAEPLLHAWNDKEWVHISLQDFREVSFVEKMPGRTIIIGDDKTVPAALLDAASWSPEIIRMRDLNTAAIVNECGRVFKWDERQWKWFAQRYNLKLNDETEALRKSSWYDQPGPLYRPPLKNVIFERSSTAEPAPAPVNPVSETKVEAAPVVDVAPVTPVPETAPAAVEAAPASSWTAPAPVNSATP